MGRLRFPYAVDLTPTRATNSGPAAVANGSSSAFVVGWVEGAELRVSAGSLLPELAMAIQLTATVADFTGSFQFSNGVPSVLRLLIR